jgi:hypothetical protein
MNLMTKIKTWFVREPEIPQVPPLWFDKTMGKQLVSQLKWLREERNAERSIARCTSEDEHLLPTDKMDIIDGCNQRIEMLQSIENDLIMNSHFSDDAKAELNAPESKRNFMTITALILSAMVMAISMVYMLMWIFQQVKCPCL